MHGKGIYLLSDKHLTLLFQFHGCSKCYDPNSKNFEGTRMKDLHARTVNKNNYPTSRGVKVVEIYSCQFAKLRSTDETCRKILEKFSGLPPLNPREALRGGRVECFRLLASSSDSGRIKYLDCNRYFSVDL